MCLEQLFFNLTGGCQGNGNNASVWTEMSLSYHVGDLSGEIGQLMENG